jgi:hypothetical protein
MYGWSVTSAIFFLLFLQLDNSNQSKYLAPFFRPKNMMNKAYFILAFWGTFLVSFTSTSCSKDAKCNCSADTIKIARIFQPDASLGKDAVIESIVPDQNFGSVSLLAVFSWTSNGEFNDARSLIEFDLSSLPVQTKIRKAELSLYWKPYDNLTEQTGENNFSIYRISQAWSEASITWNNQPAFTDSDKVSVPKSTTIGQSYLNIDVTRLVQDMINDPLNSYGFMLQLDNEFPYRLVVLASSNDTDESKHPKLVISF